MDMLKAIISIIFTPEFGFSVLRVTTPILFASMGAVIASKAGVNNMGLEGIMLFSALGGVLISAYTNSVLIGVIGAATVGVLIGLFMAYFSLSLNTDLVLTGIALNLVASGGTIFILYTFTGQKGTSEAIQSGSVPSMELPFIKDIPYIGEILSGQNILTYLSLLSVVFVWILLYKTTLGLRIRAVGENPDAAESVGVNVKLIQYIALMFSGLFSGFAGAYMSMGYVNFFSKDMTSGRGFIALAAKEMGRAEPVATFLTSLIFGFADALANNLQILHVPPEFVQMIPYVATIIGLVVYSLRVKRESKKVVNKKIIKNNL